MGRQTDGMGDTQPPPDSRGSFPHRTSWMEQRSPGRPGGRELRAEARGGPGMQAQLGPHWRDGREAQGPVLPQEPIQLPHQPKGSAPRLLPAHTDTTSDRMAHTSSPAPLTGSPAQRLQSTHPGRYPPPPLVYRVAASPCLHLFCPPRAAAHRHHPPVNAHPAQRDVRVYHCTPCSQLLDKDDTAQAGEGQSTQRDACWIQLVCAEGSWRARASSEGVRGPSCVPQILSRSPKPQHLPK